MLGLSMLKHARRKIPDARVGHNGHWPRYVIDEQSLATLEGMGLTRPVLELSGVSKMFGSLVALDSIDLCILAGERCAILGANGAGKTTLFNAISGDFPVSSGQVRFLGQDVTTVPGHHRIRRGLRRTYQISQLFGGLSVQENLYLACRGVLGGRFSVFRPSTNDSARIAADKLLCTVKLESDRDVLVETLSHGQQRQLEIGLALSENPTLILLDEPAAGLSPSERTDLIEVLHSLPRHVAYVLIEHDMDVALRVADRVVMMNNGRIFKQGLPHEIEEDAEVQELYLGASHV